MWVGWTRCLHLADWSWKLLISFTPLPKFRLLCVITCADEFSTSDNIRDLPATRQHRPPTYPAQISTTLAKIASIWSTNCFFHPSCQTSKRTSRLTSRKNNPSRNYFTTTLCWNFILSVDFSILEFNSPMLLWFDFLLCKTTTWKNNLLKALKQLTNTCLAHRKPIFNVDIRR